jgi:hypothetical protein
LAQATGPRPMLAVYLPRNTPDEDCAAAFAALAMPEGGGGDGGGWDGDSGAVACESEAGVDCLPAAVAVAAAGWVTLWHLDERRTATAKLLSLSLSPAG